MRLKFIWTAVLLTLLTSPALAQDQIAVNLITNDSRISDVLDWPVTKAITKIAVAPSEGWSFEGTFLDWPEVPVFGPGPCVSVGTVDDGCLQYTVWPVARVGGVWHTAGEIQMWLGRASTGSFGRPTWAEDFPANWGYNVGSLAGYHPQVGDQMGFFLTAGNARQGQASGVTSLRERTNIVVLTLPPNDTGSVRFDAPPPVAVPVVPPVIVPPVVITDPPVTPPAVIDLTARVSTLEQLVAILNAWAMSVEARILPLEARPIIAGCSASVLGIPVSCKLK